MTTIFSVTSDNRTKKCFEQKLISFQQTTNCNIKNLKKKRFQLDERTKSRPLFQMEQYIFFMHHSMDFLIFCEKVWRYSDRKIISLKNILTSTLWNLSYENTRTDSVILRYFYISPRKVKFPFQIWWTYTHAREEYKCVYVCEYVVLQFLWEESRFATTRSVGVPHVDRGNTVQSLRMICNLAGKHVRKIRRTEMIKTYECNTCDTYL